MFEEDYIIRTIKEMVRTILKLLFHIDAKTPTSDILENEVEKKRLEKLIDMVNHGQINEAENELYDFLDGKDKKQLKLALLFYSHLNDKTDEFLEENQFSREEIKLGIGNVTRQFGLGSITEMFFTEF